MPEEVRVKVTEVRPIMLDRFLLAEVVTDAGISDFGESGA
jgi:hypothetical protein